MSPHELITQPNLVSQHGSWELISEAQHRAEEQIYYVRGRKGSPFSYWFESAGVPKSRGLRHEQWVAERLRFAVRMLRETIEVNPQKRGGVPVLSGTRVPVAQILAEIADDASVSEIAAELDLDAECIRKLLEGIASYLDRPFFR
jgi:uncharacterized protein (DUF433 family)